VHSFRFFCLPCLVTPLSSFVPSHCCYFPGRRESKHLVSLSLLHPCASAPAPPARDTSYDGGGLALVAAAAAAAAAAVSARPFSHSAAKSAGAGVRSV